MAARDDFAAGRIDAGQLRAAEDEAIAAAVTMQRDVGLQDATDGEFRRATWHMDFINQIGGIGQAAGTMKVRFRNASGDIEWTPAAIHVDRKLAMTKTIFGDHFEYLKSLARDVMPKLTIPSPNMVHYRGGPAAIDNKVYPDPDEFWHDLAAAYQDEITRLHALGCTYLQLDDMNPSAASVRAAASAPRRTWLYGSRAFTSPLARSTMRSSSLAASSSLIMFSGDRFQAKRPRLGENATCLPSSARCDGWFAGAP